MDDAGLDCRLGKDCGDRLGKALQPIDDSEENVLNAPVLHLVHDLEPELGAFVLLQPEAENLLGAVGAHAERDMDSLVANEALISDLHADRGDERAAPIFDSKRISCSLKRGGIFLG